MFKELKVIKLIIIAGLFFTLIWKIDFKALAISELYTDKLSYFPGEKVKIFVSTKAYFIFDVEIEISGLTNDFLTHISSDVYKQKAISDNVLIDGLGYSDYIEFEIPQELQPGIYLIHNKHPLIVKAQRKADITVIYPAMNNVLYHKVGAKSVFSENSSKTSLLRSVIVDKYSHGMVDFLSDLGREYRVNYVTDLDLEDSLSFSSSKLLIIYGKSTFWTPGMIDNLIQYQEKGGNVLNITSYLANNICWHTNLNEIQLMDSSKVFKSWEQIDSSIPLSLTGVLYRFSGFSNNKYYRIGNHHIFNGVDLDEIMIDADLFSGPPVVWKEGEPVVDVQNLAGHSCEILAYSKATFDNIVGVKGISLFQRTATSGKVMSLGTEDWCEKTNIGENKNLQIITINAVDFLIKDSP